MAGVCFLYRTVQTFLYSLSQHILTQHLWLPSTSIMVNGLDLDLPKVTQPGAAESGLSPGLLDFRAPAHNHCTILPPALVMPLGLHRTRCHENSAPSQYKALRGAP